MRLMFFFSITLSLSVCVYRQSVPGWSRLSSCKSAWDRRRRRKSSARCTPCSRVTLRSWSSRSCLLPRTWRYERYIFSLFFWMYGTVDYFRNDMYLESATDSPFTFFAFAVNLNVVFRKAQHDCLELLKTVHIRLTLFQNLGEWRSAAPNGTKVLKKQTEDERTRIWG